MSRQEILKQKKAKTNPRTKDLLGGRKFGTLDAST